MNHYKNKKLLCDQVVYFNRPRGHEFDDLTYVEFFKRYTYYRRSPIAFLPENHHRLSALSGIYGPKDVIVKKRLRSDNAIIRLSTLSIKSGDLYLGRGKSYAHAGFSVVLSGVRWPTAFVCLHPVV